MRRCNSTNGQVAATARASAYNVEVPRKDRAGQAKPEDRIALPLDPEEALRALMAVDPDDEPVESDEDAQ